MQFEHLSGRRIVPHLLALFHLPVTCHLSGHIPPPAESRGGWPLSSTSIRHSPPAESLGYQAGRLTLTFPELLGTCSPYGVAQRMHLSSALRVLCVWSGSMALAGSRPVYVCLQTVYGLNSSVFLSTLLHMPYPNRGVVWRSVQSLFTRLLPRLLLIFCFPAYVHLYVKCCQSITGVWTVFPPELMQIGIRRCPESPCTCSYIRSSLDHYLSTDSSV